MCIFPVSAYNGAMNFHHLNPVDHPSIPAAEARVEYFDENFPAWRTLDRFVDYADVDRPDETLVMRTFGGDHRGLLFGAHS